MTSYREAGVDLAGAARHVESIAPAVTSTWAGDVVGVFGGFAAGVRIPAGIDDPILMMSTDGVGTKLDIARRTGRWDGVGHDLVAMCVDDLAATGARPIGFVDYMAVGSLDPDRDRAIVDSIADACRLVGCPLLGGETAEHPDVMALDAVDLAGAAMGVVGAEEVLGPDRVRIGDVVIGLRSPNLRSNGFSLVRSVLGDAIEEHATELLAPSVLYARDVLAASEGGRIHAAAHITGGGIRENLARALPGGTSVTVDRGAWQPPNVYELVESAGVSSDEMWATFNMGIGFCVLVDRDDVDEVAGILDGHRPVVVGVVEEGTGVRFS